MHASLALIVALAMTSCGGSSPPPESPKPRAGARPKPRPERETEEAPAPRRSNVACDDGSCFACGDAVCLSGFYCSIGRSGRGCAWLPSCAVKPNCACIASSFRDDPSCACEEREGGIYVTCDGAKL